MPVSQLFGNRHQSSNDYRVQKEPCDDEWKSGPRVRTVDAFLNWRFISAAVDAAHRGHLFVIPDFGKRLAKNISNWRCLVKNAGRGVDVPIRFDEDWTVPQASAGVPTLGSGAGSARLHALDGDDVFF